MFVWFGFSTVAPIVDGLEVLKRGQRYTPFISLHKESNLLVPGTSHNQGPLYVYKTLSSFPVVEER